MSAARRRRARGSLRRACAPCAASRSRSSRGEIVGLIGPNGAGKSSTLHAIMGAAPVAAGDVRLGGASLLGRAPEDVARSGVALVPEGRRIFAELTVEENLRLGLAGRRAQRRRGRRDRARLRALPDRARVPQPRTPARSRAASSSSSRSPARSSPSPTCCCSTSRRSGSRRRVVDVVFDALAAIRERGLAVLLVEQRAQRTVALADRTHVLANGELRLTLGPRRRRRHRDARGGVLLVIARRPQHRLADARRRARRSAPSTR